ncbi:AraC family transcriptional regulator [Dulcicalothrix desertica PCC 7102]|uniref:AraC family transcriptional regulator n=1 Tax=Dulcicalothrix desertica PCC 7102 TaxID=232991 RepID=A0A433VW58_9CYAN|nr:AraC family transcriptional regulator [Dulcicalothrix desertica]RUT10320.1 AraC family transcriptional regulator [Dulcicalothrix desertica PCC 7102]TWH40708.1 AraC family transcriptional regulator [Dulcicalothrix desertica PCC 7102]
MDSSQPNQVDFSQQQERSPVTQRPWLRSSHGLGWNHLSLHHKRCPPLEIPELQPLQHIIEINLLPNSRAEYRANGRLYESNVSYGSMMLAPAYTCYQIATLSDAESVSISLEPDFVARTAYEILDSERVELVLAPGTFDPLIYGIGMSLKAELESSSPVSNFYIDSLANTLATHLLRNYITCTDSRMVAVEESQHNFIQVIDYVEAYLEQPIELEELARIAGMSRFYFCRLFKKTIGLTPHQFVIKRRIERAKHLLFRSNLSISEIAVACGFANQNHLTRYFKRLTNVTPSVFRQRAQ